MDKIGVRPERRRQGLGTRLHRHLLARLSEQHGRLTSVDNHDMRRIFDHSGSQHVGTQRYFRQP
ncbi:GNAT family N-acetyltransferase [Deinococcus yunweiensis]|uniref:GNAT family N-acetyltransferase n=1 Tax=Deinococcus yunweiensis TaxID=367282 RepID=UPI00398F1CAB